MIFVALSFIYQKMPSRTRISDEDLVQIFGPSPLSRRRIRQLLGRPSNKVVSAVIFSAVERGVISKVNPSDVGYGGHRRSSYTVKPN